MLAQSLYLQGRDDEAMALTSELARSEARHIETCVDWRLVRAGVLARGRHPDAESFAREAVSLAETTDLPNVKGDAYAGLSHVLRLLGNTRDAEAAARRAFENFQEKGNIASVRRLTRHLESRRESALDHL